MTDERTISVTGHFGNQRDVTKEQFVKVWVDHARELGALGLYVTEETKRAAENVFEDKFELQNHD